MEAQSPFDNCLRILKSYTVIRWTTLMEFLAYPKISTEFATSTSTSGGSWVAQEKIHGAQLVIAVNSSEIKFGKRKAWLEEQDGFFGWQLIRVELQTQCRRMFEGLRLPNDSIAYFYGELFGGEYPHSLVKTIEGTQAVQTGIWYSPFVHWAPFDAVILPSGNLEDAYFLGAGDLVGATEAVSSVCPPVLARGPLSELLRAPVRFQSKVPAKFGLPEILHNWAEGVVIKPEASVAVSKRPIVKRKIEEFDEKRFDESEAWDADKILSIEGLKTWSEKMINPARVSSARSKVGIASESDLLEEVVLDTMIDLEAAFPMTFRLLDEARESDLRRHIQALAQKSITK